MAIYHLSVKLVSRKTGRSSVAAAAYRARERIRDERTGLMHDYTKKKDLVHSEIVMPAGCGWRPTRSELWNAAELKNKRADARTARELEVALPVELNDDGNKCLALEFAHRLADRYGIACDVAIHADEDNPHAHILTTTDGVSDKGLGNKVRELDLVAVMHQKDSEPVNAVEAVREAWAVHINRALERAGIEDVRVDHRSLAAQGIDREPEPHFGPAVLAMEARGIDTDVMARLIESEELSGVIADVRRQAAKEEKELRELLEKAKEEERLSAALKKSPTKAKVEQDLSLGHGEAKKGLPRGSTERVVQERKPEPPEIDLAMRAHADRALTGGTPIVFSAKSWADIQSMKQAGFEPALVMKKPEGGLQIVLKQDGWLTDEEIARVGARVMQAVPGVTHEPGAVPTPGRVLEATGRVYSRCKEIRQEKEMTQKRGPER